MDWSLNKDTATFYAACIAAAAALFTAFVSPRLTRGNERAKWIREQRHINYAQFIAAVQAHVLQDLRHRSETSMLQAYQSLPALPDDFKTVLKRLELQSTVAAYPAAMETIKEVFRAANGARLVASKQIEPLIQPLVEMLLERSSEGYPSGDEEERYQTAITSFIRQARQEISTDASLYNPDPADWLLDMESNSRTC